MRAAAVVSVLVVASLLGCSFDVALNTPAAGDTVDTDTTGTDTTGTDTTGTVQRAALSVTVTVAPADWGLAAAVGSPDGLLREALVTIQRQPSGALTTDTTDAGGVVTFTALLPGTYAVSAVRLLTPEETAAFEPADQDVNAFGGGGVVGVTAPSTTRQVEVAAGRRGSLVISEVFSGEPYAPTPQYYYYYFGHYLELYNNADTTIQLGGKVVGRGIAWLREYTNSTCAVMEGWRNDPDGIWTKFFDAFPSRALAPGAAVLVATDAIDHSAIVPGMPDLSGADFEFRGSNDADNPGVPNMIRSGLREWAEILGHGLAWPNQDGVVFVAESLTVSALPTDNLPVQDPPHVRIPGAKVLDVFTSGSTPALEATATADGYPLCPQLVHANFDRQYANLLDNRVIESSITRRVVTRLPDGRKLLLRTRTSRNDFEVAARTPGTVP